MNQLEQRISKLLPLTPAVFHILLAVADGERHGYGIMKVVVESTHGKIRMGAGTLYGTIKRMQKDALVEETRSRRPTLAGKPRRYYRITQFGRQVAMAEARRLETLVQLARSKDLLPSQS